MSKFNKDNLMGDEDEVKSGRLESDADIYQQRDDKTAKENYKNLSAHDKLYYFKDYYLKYLIIIVAMAIIGIYVIYSVTRREKDMDLYVGYIDCFYDTHEADDILENFANYMGFKYNTADFADDSFLDNQTDNGWLSNYLDKGKLDVLVMNKDWFKGYATCDFLVDLSDYLDTEEYKDYLVTEKNSEGNEKYFGFKCNSVPIYNSSNLNKLEMQDAYLVILKNSSQIENAVNYLKYSVNYKYEDTSK